MIKYLRPIRYGIPASIFCLFMPCLTVASSLQQPDSVKVAIAPEYDQVSGWHRNVFGESWRKLWATPVKMKVFHLNRERGGLKITERGGGMQTKSLRLKDSEGHEWVLRTVQKNPEKTLPEDLRKTFVKDIVQDQISAEHPFAFLVVPPLADAVGVPHANPQIVYVPDDPAFGKYRKDFAKQVFLFEEREPLDIDKTDNTDKVDDKLQEDHDNYVDQKTFLRARLLDMILGDWDRHSDQWRWERIKTGDGIKYEPVPRDRDQVFYNSSGVLPWLFSRHLLMAKFQNYGDHIRSINRWNLNNQSVDRFFMTELSEDDWKREIAYVQSKLTDQVIRDAVKRMPADIYKLSGDELIRKLIARRNNMSEQGIKYYKFLSGTVNVTASDKKEHIDIINQPDGKLKVKVYKQKKDDSIGDVIYNRVFDPAVTHEVRIYGFGGKDVFNVKGSQPSPIKLRMIGGDGEDTFTADSTLHNRGNILIYDRSDQPNNLPKGSEARIKTSTDTIVNYFDRKGYKYNYLQPLFLLSYSKDYGVEIIGDFIYKNHGFRKDPYGTKQSLLVNYGTRTQSLMLNYKADFQSAIGKNDLLINVLSKGPNYVSNFFGTGNNSVFINDDAHKLHYYRNVYNYIDGDIQLRRKTGNWTITGGPRMQYYNGDPDDNQDRYLKVYNQSHPNEEVFTTQTYAGLIGSFEYDSRNTESIIPHKGIYWKNNLTGMTGLNQSGHTFGQWISEFTFYIAPGADSVFVIADRTGAGITFGNAAYFQQIRLGGSQNLRGYYHWRFTGKNAAYNNLEVRLKLLDFESYIAPGAFGLVAFNDIGRVWSPGEKSSTWHDGYGGGFYFAPAQLILVQAVMGFSNEGAYPYISAGFRF